MTARVLVVDDDPAECSLLEASLGTQGFAVSAVTSAEAALELLMGAEFDVVVTDLNMKAMTGIQLCEQLIASHPDVAVVVVTAFGSIQTAVAAIRSGAYDFQSKPFDLQALALTVERAAKHRALTKEVTRLRRIVADTERFEELLGSSPAMKKVYDLVDRIAETDASVLVTGESGTGKELLARAIHQRSKRRAGPFVAINCAAMTETLLESELFGHAKGAFTDAKTARRGLFVEADRGTLFLDEIGELPLGLQPKLLRALQERKVRPVGGNVEVPFDARLVCATNRDLEAAAQESRFRNDLFYRINVVHLHMPSLRARGADVLLLSQAFLVRCAHSFDKPVRGLAPEVAERLLAYPWPGNVRELGNCIEHAVAVSQGDCLTLEDLPKKVRDFSQSQVSIAGTEPSSFVPLGEMERRYILRVFEALDGNKSLVAHTLGVDRKTLYRKLKEYGVSVDTHEARGLAS
ncbi:MAG TPA: sigma-54 dependent transcriptional regulator [Polyangiaceae bacterium]|nr:sigma-54 dependent transcriptional regulator [Polyangiaceae bacterium]